MGHLTKTDSRVSERETALAELVIDRMNLSPDTRRVAIGLFAEGKMEGFPLDDVLAQFRASLRGRAARTGGGAAAPAHLRVPENPGV